VECIERHFSGRTKLIYNLMPGDIDVLLDAGCDFGSVVQGFLLKRQRNLWSFFYFFSRIKK
jgi:hypothetical protein